MKNHAGRAVNRASEKRFRIRCRLAAVGFAGVLLLLPNVAWAGFVGGPTARVSPNFRVEIRWIADFVGDGRVDVFDNPDGSGAPIDVIVTTSQGNDHTIRFTVGGVIKPDTTYYYKVTHIDPTGVRGDLTNDPAPFSSFFTGEQPPGADPEQPKLTAPNGAADASGLGIGGVSVAISGHTVVVGAPSADSIEDPVGFREGAAYVFVKPEGGWAATSTFAARLIASDGAGFARFGGSVAIDGDTVVVGAPSTAAAYVFVKPADGWAGDLSEAAKLTSSDGAGFASVGASVAIGGDIVVVGAPSADSKEDLVGFEGAAYVFVKPEGGWATTNTFAARLTASDGAGSARFGGSVAIEGDRVLIGASGDEGDKGGAYVFLEPAGGWAGDLTEAAKLTASDGLARDRFGSAVAMSGDNLVVGAPFSGKGAYVFAKPAGGWAGNLLESAKLTASDVAPFDFLGNSVAIHGDRVLIGASGGEHAKGAAYIFLEPAEGWAGNLNEAVKLTAADGETLDFLGSSVAISGDILVVGADEWGDFQASAYVFSSPTAPIDLTPPAITPVISGTLGSNGWYVDNVIVTWNVQDAESAITSTSGCDPASVTSDTTGATVTCTATSTGGTASESVTIMLDKTPPAVVCGAPDGLWHDTDVAIACTADGSISGLANPADAAFKLVTNVPAGTETANAATGSHTVSDNAGNVTVVGPIAGSMVDKKAPDITINVPLAGAYLLNQAVAAAYSCSDGGSGLASCTGPVASGQNLSTSVPGANSFTVNAADLVSNASSLTTSYQVQYPGEGTLCNGAPGHQILEPIRTDGSSVFRQKSTVPAKFRVCDANGISVGAPGLVTGFHVIQVIPGTVVSDVNEAMTSTTPDSTFRWDSVEQQWIFNIGNQTLQPNATYVFRISLNDGTHIDFQYGVK